MTKVYKDAVGLRIRVQTGIDLEDDSPTVAQIMVRKPDGTLATWEAEVEAPASGGVIYFDTIAGSLDQSGSYRFQARVQRDGDANVLPLGETGTLEVHDPFQ